MLEDSPRCTSKYTGPKKELERKWGMIRKGTRKGKVIRKGLFGEPTPTTPTSRGEKPTYEAQVMA